MQTCPFCNFDAGDRPLNEGRCPQCGSIIQWSDEDINATIQSFHAQAIEASSDASKDSTNDDEQLSNRPEPLGDTFGYAKLERADAINNVEPGTKPPESSSAGQSVTPSQPIGPAQPPGNRGSDPNPNPTPTPALLSRLWKDSLESKGSVRSTLKGAESDATVLDTVFSIQSREVRPVSDTPSDTLDYELLGVIGQGGVGVVYSARQASIDRNVALKMLREEYRNREDHRDKFLAEAVLTGELDHPNIVPIYDLGRSHSGELFYSMKNVVGTPWDRVIATKTLEENLDILLKVADAVAFAHSRGVIHRDLKPENVMLGNFGEVLVMDWGIALPTAEFRKSSSILRSQAMGGTPAYMAPEMAKGPIETIGPVSDVYLLGAILFEILTGSPPHYGVDVMDCVTNAAKNIIRESDVTGELMDIAFKAMATLQRRRHRTVQDFQAAIRLYQAHSESICLSDNAEREFKEALQQKDYQKFSRVVFAFQESIALWSENKQAQAGLTQAKLAYAETALEKGDYDLGLSLLEPVGPAEKKLIDKLKAAIAEREARQGRLRTLRRAAVGMVAFIIIAGCVTLTTIWRFYKQAEVAKIAAVAEKDLAKEAREKADKAAADAVTEREKADKQRELTEIARRKTEVARLQSLADRRRAEENAYIAETGLIAASIAQNNFAIARSFLQQQANSPSKSSLRHWEWGRFQYLVQGGGAKDSAAAVDTHSVDETVESVDCLPDVSLIALGLGNGICQLWQADQPRIIQWANGRMVTDLDLDSTGKLLVTCGLNDSREGCVRVWQVNDNQPPTLLKERTLDRQPNCVAFCNKAGSAQVVIGDAKNVVRVWTWQSDQADRLLLGHNAGINQVEYSPDDRWVGAASSDGTVRIFDATTGKESQRFSGHDGAVWCLAFSPDNQTVASGGEDQHVLLWSIETDALQTNQIQRTRLEVAGKPTPDTSFVALPAHSGTVRDLSFSADGARLASAGTDNLVCIWKLTETKSSSNERGRGSVMNQLKQPSTADAAKPVDVPVLRLRGHGGWVHSCVLSKDGSQVVSGADDYSWRVWRVDQYREMLALGDGNLPIGDAQFSQDGKLVVLAMSDGTIQMWDRYSGKIVHKLTQGHEYLTNRAQLIDGDDRLVTAAGDNTLRIWDVDRGNQLRVMEHSGRNAFFGVTPDARWLISTGDEKGVAVWDLASKNEPARFRVAPTRPVNTSAVQKKFTEPASVAISDDGQYFVVGESTGLCEFWDRTTGQKLHSVYGHGDAVIAAFALPSTPDKPIFLTASADGTVAWWNALDGKEIPGGRLAPRTPIQSACISGNRRYLASSSMLGNGKGRLWLWDLQTRKSIASYDTNGKSVQDLAFRKAEAAEDVELIVTTADLKNSTKELWAWSPARNEYQSIQRPGWLTASTWGTTSGDDPDSILIYGGRGARLWSWQHDRPVMQYRSSASVTAVALSPDNQLLASANEDGSIILWDLAEKTPRETFAHVHDARINDLSFSRDGRQLASVGADGLVILRSLADGSTLVKRLDDKSISLNSVAFSPDGSLIAITADDEVLRVHDTKTLDQKHKFSGHTGQIHCAEFSPDQRWLASGGEDKIIRIWSLAEDKLASELLGHSADVTSLNFSGDGLRLLSGSRDTSAKLWDVSRSIPNSTTSLNTNNSADLRELLTLEQHSSDVISVQFSPDGSEVLTAGMEGQAILWPACQVALALRLSTPSVDYPLGKGKLILDPQALIAQTSFKDISGAVLRITLLPEDTETAPTELPKDFSDKISLDTSDEFFELAGEQVLLKASQQPVAEIKRLADGTIEIKLAEWITHNVAQQLIRRLCYEANSKELDAAVKHTRTYQFELLNAAKESGNASPVELIINLIDPDSANRSRSDILTKK